MSFQKEGYTGGALIVENNGRLRMYQAGKNAFRYLPCGIKILSAVWVGPVVQVNLENGIVLLRVMHI